MLSLVVALVLAYIVIWILAVCLRSIAPSIGSFMAIRDGIKAQKEREDQASAPVVESELVMKAREIEEKRKRENQWLAR